MASLLLSVVLLVAGAVILRSSRSKRQKGIASGWVGAVIGFWASIGSSVVIRYWFGSV